MGRADRLDRVIYCGPRRKIRVLILSGGILNQDIERSGLATSNVKRSMEERWSMEKREKKEEDAAASKKTVHLTE